MKKLLLCALALLLTAAPAAGEPNTISAAETEVSVNSTTQISNTLSFNERRVRNASVRVITHQGHGTGSLIKYRGMHLVLTAHHVADGALGQKYLLSTETEQEWGVLIYKDPLNDMSLLYLPNHFRYAEPMKYRPRAELVDVGQTITYSGYPSWHSLLSFRGHVAGFETHPEAGRQIILHTYGWFGCSGSVIYDPDGKIIGVLWAVDVERRPTLQVQENIIWVSPIQNLDIDLALSALCNSMPEKPRACR
jgi:hypothetical protein